MSRRRPERPPGSRLALAQAIALGALHGPAELLPISSSAHTTLVPWLLGWPYASIDPELRKAFEIALHAGTAAALLVGLRDEVAEAARGLDRRRLTLLAGSFAPPAVVGYALERPIERRLGTPPTIAAGLAAGGVAMAAADALAPQRRTRSEANLADALLLGVAQACALMPGVSRNGATLTAARARGFRREDSNAMSRHVALPVILGATALKGARLARRGLPPGVTRSFAAGIAASFLSTLASVRLIRAVERDRSLAPYAAYRLALAALVLWRARRPWTSPAETSAAAPKRRPWSEGAGAAGTMTGDD
ncbi:MAG: undecaprenyl-diphosphatase [Solirubrobacteraceae bacterium]|nr:undecaprenyl-diphosphatase [Solirubrobacteraceae bacterium]